VRIVTVLHLSILFSEKMMTPYNGFLIEVYENSFCRWRVRVARQDGCMIEIDAAEYEALTTDMESFSADDAITVAKAMIDVIIAKQGGPPRVTRH
jgi:hypothetical protein